MELFLMFLLCVAATVAVLVGCAVAYQSIRDILDEERQRKRSRARQKAQEKGVVPPK